MKLRIAICDDEQKQIDYLKTTVSEWAKTNKYLCEIKTFPSAEAFLFEYSERKDYDIILLDIEMKEMNGVELAKHIRSENERIQIVFITGYPDFISEGYDVCALHYLMKPVSKEKLSDVLDRAVKNLGVAERTVILRVGTENIKLSVEKVIYAEAFSHSVNIVTTTKIYDVKMTITDVEKLFGDDFIRCHRSYIVGLKHIKSISKAEITLDNGQKLPLARGTYASVNQAFIKYYMGGSQ